MLLKEYVGSGCSLLKRQQTGQVGGQERLLYFRCQQLGGWGAGCLSKGWLPSLPYKQGVRTLIDGAGVGIDAETAQSALTVILKLVTGSLTSINLFKVVTLQFQGPFVPISLWPVLWVVAAHVLGADWSSKRWPDYILYNEVNQLRYTYILFMQRCIKM